MLSSFVLEFSRNSTFPVAIVGRDVAFNPDLKSIRFQRISARYYFAFCKGVLRAL